MGGGVDWPLDWPSISLHGRVSPQPWREIDAHASVKCLAIAALVSTCSSANGPMAVCTTAAGNLSSIIVAQNYLVRDDP